MQHVSSHFNVLPIIISQYLYYSTKCAVLRNWAVAFIHAKEGTQAATFPRFQQWLLGGVRVVHFGRCRSLFYSFKFVSTRTFPVGKEGADNPPTMGAETADHTLQFGHDLLLSLPLSLSLSLSLPALQIIPLHHHFLLLYTSSTLDEEFRPANQL